jgi:hypothetical protein
VRRGRPEEPKPKLDAEVKARSAARAARAPSARTSRVLRFAVRSAAQRSPLPSQAEGGDEIVQGRKSG